MRLWRAQFQDPDEGACVVWAGSERRARRLLRAVMEATAESYEVDLPLPEFFGPVKVCRVDVPTDKRGLVAWLNSNLSRDNG